jgi:prevent-host-death family protein
MKSATLVQAKTHLSEIVDDAERRGVSTLIRRHGKPVAVLVPLSVGQPNAPPMTREAIEALHAAFAMHDNPKFSAVDDTMKGRER